MFAGLRHARGHQPALQVPARARPDRPVDGVRHADAHGLRPRPPALARRGRPRGRVGRVARRHGAPLRRHPARRGHDVDDDQRAGGRAARVLRRGRRAAGRLARQAARHAAERHAQGVHRAEGVDLRRPRPSMRIIRDMLVCCTRARCRCGTRSRSAAITSARPARPRCRSWPSRSPTASATSQLGHRARASTSTTSRRGCRSSWTCTTTSSRRSRSSAPARRMWARIMRERFGAKNPRSWLLRTHAQTAGVSLMAQQPLNNVVRTTLQALAAVLGGTQSLHTNSLDETLRAADRGRGARSRCARSRSSPRRSGVAAVADPLGGSYFVETLDRSGRGGGVGVHPADRRDGRHRARDRGGLPAARDRALGLSSSSARSTRGERRDRRREQVRDARGGRPHPDAEDRPRRRAAARSSGSRRSGRGAMRRAAERALDGGARRAARTTSRT